MVAVDTNVVVRLLTDDEPRQADAARALFSSEDIWIAKTVLLETGWVLRSLYGFDEGAIARAFTKILGLKRVHVEDGAGVTAALDLTTRGIELADAFHLSGRPASAIFVTFDKALILGAKRAGVAGVGRPGRTQ